MEKGDFHIKIADGQKTHYRISDTLSDRQLLLLPFEQYHQPLFGLPLLHATYSIPNRTLFYLHPSHEIIMDGLKTPGTISIQCDVTRKSYVDSVNQIKKHIQRGDIYEMNFCFDFYAENASVNPLEIFEKLNTVSQAPFSSLTKIGDLYIICASPERYIQKKGTRIISQPMKGTAPRNSDPVIDEENKNRLRSSLKEQNENVMIVDLVRNDLSRIAHRGSVKVDELFGISSFATVHQMISTISCENNHHSLEEILQATFPMGSMTGAPKKKVLELINRYEKKARGIYSGTIGIVKPNGDFDLAVIIRSIVYDAKNKYLSFSVGSAITAGCNPEEEYEECLLKAKTMMNVLTS